MIATGVRGGVVLAVGPDGVMQDLHDCLGVWIVEGRTVAKGGASTVDSERHGRAEEKGEKGGGRGDGE